MRFVLTKQMTTSMEGIIMHSNRNNLIAEPLK